MHTVIMRVVSVFFINTPLTRMNPAPLPIVVIVPCFVYLIQILEGVPLRPHAVVVQLSVFLVMVYFVLPFVQSVIGWHMPYDLRGTVMDAYLRAHDINATPCMQGTTTGASQFQRVERERTRRWFERWHLGFLFPSEQRLAWLWGRYWQQ